MFVTSTRVKTYDQPIEIATIVGEEMERWLREIDGFEGFLMLSREGSTVGVSFWQSRDVAERHRVARIQFIERMSSIVGVEVEEMVEYELTFARLSPLVAGATT